MSHKMLLFISILSLSWATAGAQWKNNDFKKLYAQKKSSYYDVSFDKSSVSFPTNKSGHCLLTLPAQLKNGVLYVYWKPKWDYKTKKEFTKWEKQYGKKYPSANSLFAVISKKGKIVTILYKNKGFVQLVNKTADNGFLMFPNIMTQMN